MNMLRLIKSFFNIAITQTYKGINRTPINRSIFSYNWLFARHIVKSYKTNNHLFKNKTICDYGAGNTPYYQLLQKNFLKYYALDFYDKTTETKSITQIPLLKNGAVPTDLYKKADIIISNQVLMELDNIDFYLNELDKLAKPNAFLFLTTPFFQPLGNNDKNRFSPFLINKKLNERHYNILIYKPCGFFFTSFAMSFNMALLLTNHYDIETGTTQISQIKGVIFAPIFAIINIVALLLDKIFPLYRVPANFLIIAKKFGN